MEIPKVKESYRILSNIHTYQKRRNKAMKIKTQLTLRLYTLRRHYIREKAREKKADLYRQLVQEFTQQSIIEDRLSFNIYCKWCLEHGLVGAWLCKYYKIEPIDTITRARLVFQRSFNDLTNGNKQQWDNFVLFIKNKNK